MLATVAKFDRELVIEVIPLAKEAITNSENRRGVGSDTHLRYDVTNERRIYMSDCSALLDQAAIR